MQEHVGGLTVRPCGRHHARREIGRHRTRQRQLFTYGGEEVPLESQIVARSDVPGLTFTPVIDGNRRSSRVKIIAVGRQRLRRFGMDQFTQMAYLIRSLQAPFIARQPLYQVAFAAVMKFE